VEARLEQLNQLRKDREEGLRLMQRLAATLEEQGRLVSVLAVSAQESRRRFERLQAQLDGLCQERDGYQQALAQEAEVLAAHRRWLEARAELERWDAAAANFREIEARRAGPLTTISNEAAGLDAERRALFTQEMAVLQEQSRLAGLDAQIAQLSAEAGRLKAELDGRAALEARLREMQEQAAQARVENGALKEAMRALKERITRLQEAEGVSCPLCGQPLSPQERAALVGELETEGKEMGDRYRANLERVTQSESSLRELQNQIGGLGRADEALRQQQRQLDRMESERQRVTEAAETWAAGGAARLAEVNRMLAQEDFAREARAALAEIDAESRALGYDAAAHDHLRREEQAGRTLEGEVRAIESARATLAPLERQIAGLETQAAAELARVSEQEQAHREAHARYAEEAARLPDIDAAEREVQDLRSEENRLRMDVGMVRQLVTVLASQRARREKLSERRESLTMQVARLKTLERAFSKDGVPALLIEQALPEIETQANEILDRLSGGAMSVRFATQRVYKDKSRDDRRETLDIIISDASGEREYEMFSGGEAFRVNFAIRLALSRVLAQRAGARLQTLVIDEGFGSQDAQGRQRLIEAINMVRTEFAKILVITHLEELKEAFPARIEVEKTLHGSRVAVVS
jgi:DNA repair protein SbcC/Rad50